MPAGKSEYAKGEILFLDGRVLDERCVPVSGAVIDLWQADADGRVAASTLGERLDPKPRFVGSGRATSDNLGRYRFVTVVPGGRDARLNFHISHPHHPVLETQAALERDGNRNDPLSIHLTEGARGHLQGEWIIVLRGRDPYRRF